MVQLEIPINGNAPNRKTRFVNGVKTSFFEGCGSPIFVPCGIMGVFLSVCKRLTFPRLTLPVRESTLIRWLSGFFVYFSGSGDLSCGRDGGLFSRMIFRLERRASFRWAA